MAAGVGDQLYDGRVHSHRAGNCHYRCDSRLYSKATRVVKRNPLQRYRSTACSKDQGNHGSKIREKPLDDEKEKVNRLRQHFDYGVNCG